MTGTDSTAVDSAFAVPTAWKAYDVADRPDSMANDLSIQLMPRPGSAFAYRDTYIYFATEMQTVVSVEERVYLMLAALLAGATYEETVGLLQSRGHDTTPGEICEVLTSYRELQLFKVPDNAVVTRDIGHAINGLMRHQPMKAMLFMAESCNLRCTYCYGIEGNYMDKGKKMSPELAERAVDYLLDNSPSRVHFYIYFFGGEPLINLTTMEHTVKYAKERVDALGKTVEFGVTTNGTLLTDRAVELLIGEDFQICVSIDGTPEGHDVNRPTKGGGGSYERVLAGYRRLKKLSRRPNQVKVRATMSHQNHSPLEIAEHLESIGITNYGIGTTFERCGSRNPPDVTSDDLVEMDGSFERFLDQIIGRLEKGQPLPRYNPFFRTAGSMSSGFRRAFIGCGVCRNDQGIGTDGAIYPCHRYVGLESYVIGNVQTGIDKGKLRAVYEQIFDVWVRHCKDCWARYTCSGACQWQYSHGDGTLRDPIAYQCESIRRSVQRSAWTNTYLSRNHPEVFKSVCRREAASGECCNSQ